MLMALLFTTFLIIISFKVLNLLIFKKVSLEQKFKLKELKKTIDEFNSRETRIIFHCEKLIRKYYSKLIIFNEEYDLNKNNIINIQVKKTDPLNSDITEKVILKSDKDEIKFIINICLNMNNHYQVILDKNIDPLSLEFVLYAKNNNFPKKINVKRLILKDYGDNEIPHLKRYNLINVSKSDFYKLYDTYIPQQLEEKNKIFINQNNSFLVNIIIEKNKIKEGRIFDLTEQIEYKDFKEEEKNLLYEIKQKIAEAFIKNNNKILKEEKYSIYRKYKKFIQDKEDKIHNIINLYYNTSFFNKYYGKEVKDEILDLIDIITFVIYVNDKGELGINYYRKYSKYKNIIFRNKHKYNNFEKLMLLINIQSLIHKAFNIKLIKLMNLCELPEKSPFVQSEKLIYDIIKKINENSALYFFYLQINSSSGTDYISLDTWFKIKFIPITKIKAHLLYVRFPFFFTYDQNDNIGAFVNPQSLITNFNIIDDVGYNYYNDLENEENDNNTIKVLFLKFHESSHSKFECGIKKDLSPRYLLNFDLQKLDSHYDTIASLKKGTQLLDSEKKGEDIGEEGYAIEMFFYDSISKTDLLLKSLEKLKPLYNVNLYIGENFKDLNKLIVDMIANKLLFDNLNENELKLKEIKARNIKIDKNPNKIREQEIIKTPLYFFRHYPLEANYQKII